MDPQACFRQIMSIVENPGDYNSIDSACEELENLMCELWEWLEKGGFPPVVDSLGIIQAPISIGTQSVLRTRIHNQDETLVISLCTPTNRGWYRMTKYTPSGQLVSTCDLR